MNRFSPALAFGRRSTFVRSQYQSNILDKYEKQPTLPKNES